MIASEVIEELQRAIDEHGDFEVHMQSLDNKERDHYHGDILYICGYHYNTNPKTGGVSFVFGYEE